MFSAKIDGAHGATEKRSLDEILRELPERKLWAQTVFSRIKRIATIPDQALVLDLGAASGEFLLACSELGYRSAGLEPCEEARRHATSLADLVGVPIHCVAAVAESIPYKDETFNVVHASSVIEHVAEVEQAFAEIYRVLKKGGVFWFNAASAMCPVQHEIRRFPMFGWYPDALKQRIMSWAKTERPHLIGHTDAPAVNWFTPARARRLLRKHGFAEIYDRWDIRGEVEGGKAYKVALKAIRSTRLSKTLADIVVPGCSYTAIK